MVDAARCPKPSCVLLSGHLRPCRPTNVAVCGAWMPHARTHCARRVGHAGYRNTGAHQTRDSLDNRRDARWAGVR